MSTFGQLKSPCLWCSFNCRLDLHHFYLLGSVGHGCLHVIKEILDSGFQTEISYEVIWPELLWGHSDLLGKCKFVLMPVAYRGVVLIALQPVPIEHVKLIVILRTCTRCVN